MVKCAKCDRQAGYKAVRRFQIIPMRTTLLCEEHRRKFERVEDVVLMAALAIGLVVLAVSYLNDRKVIDVVGDDDLSPNTVVYDARDLDRDGYVTWFEEQVTDQQLRNFEYVGYPFAAVLRPGDPTKTIKYKIGLDAFMEAAHLNDQEAPSILTEFGHPRLMRAFLEKHTRPDAELQLRAIYVTHDEYLALVMGKPDDEQLAMILLEKISPDREARLAALTRAEPDKKKKK